VKSKPEGLRLNNQDAHVSSSDCVAVSLFDLVTDYLPIGLGCSSTKLVLKALKASYDRRRKSPLTKIKVQRKSIGNLFMFFPM
jgi:hypothetical protein